MKKCLFHYPGEIANTPSAGSDLRPKMMLDAFKENGYEVTEITGYGAERKEKIEKVKYRINKGEKYDFLYSESRNIPTLLSEKNHLPRYPKLDFSFFKFCKNNGIKIGLFYRDIYWKFDIIKNNTNLLKRSILVPMFKYDLYMYKKLVDKLYVPTKYFEKYLPYQFDLSELPPGGQLHYDVFEKRLDATKNTNALKIFYVGGVTGLYDIRTFCKTIKESDDIFLTLCTPKDQWDEAVNLYEPYLCDRINVVHKKNKELKTFYEEADVASLCIEKSEYREIAMPIKAFEAISYGIPIISTKGVAIADFVEQNDIGWTTEYSELCIKELLTKLKKNYKEIRTKTENTINVSRDNTWQKRAEKVAEELTK